MYVSYPLGAVNFDDNQAAQAYMMGELAEGNPLIGNVRYNTGYAFVMSPLWTLTRAFGRLGRSPVPAAANDGLQRDSLYGL